MIAPIPLRNAIRLVAALAGLTLWCGAALAELYTVPLLAPPGASGGPQGVLRIVNGAAESGTVTIHAIDDAGMRSGPATFTLNPLAAAEFTAAELRSGNAARSLAGGIGADVGDVRLVIETSLDIVPLAFVRAADGTLSAMNDTVRATEAQAGRFRYDVPVFNPAAEVVQASRLRLINPGDEAAAVTIAGLDDGGAAATGGDVTLTLPAGGARTLTARQIEAGDAGLTGQLGAPGLGRWRLAVKADRPLQVMNIVTASAGYWSNLSATATATATATAVSTGTATSAGTEMPVGGASLDTVYVAAGMVGGLPADAWDQDATLGTGNADVTSGDSILLSGGVAGGGYVGGGDYGYTGGTVTEAQTMPAADSDVAPSFELDEDNRSPEGIAWSDGRLHVVDRSTDKVFAYGVEGYVYAPPEWRRQPSQDFDLHPDNASPTGIAWSDGLFHVVDSSDDKVYAYAYGGQRRAEADFDLHPDNSRPEGVIRAERRFYVVDRGEDKAFAYGTDGQREAEADFDLRDGNGNPAGIAWSGGRFYVADATDAKVYAYGAGGVREAEYDFDLREDNGRPEGIAWADGRFRAVDATEDKVYVYAAPAVPADGGHTVYAAGDTILSLSTAASYRLDDGRYVEQRGYRYTCRSPAGCEIGGGAVASGTVVRTPGGVDATDAQPEFPVGRGPGDLAYTVGEPIADLTLPEAGGGDGALTYSLSPAVPGLSFEPTARQLTGTPMEIGTYAMTYTVADADGDADTLAFAVVVKEASSFRLGGDNGWARGVVWADDRFYVVDNGRDSVYAYNAAWQREASADFDLDAGNGSPRGIAWANGRFHVTDHRGGKVYAYGADGRREASADFALDAGNSSPRGIVWAGGRFYVVDLGGKVYAYGADGRREASADFALDAGNRGAHGIAWANGRFHVTDYLADKVYAYGADGRREASADFALDRENTFSVGIALANGRFHVVDSIRDRVFAYDAP